MPSSLTKGVFCLERELWYVLMLSTSEDPIDSLGCCWILLRKSGRCQNMANNCETSATHLQSNITCQNMSQEGLARAHSFILWNKRGKVMFCSCHWHSKLIKDPTLFNKFRDLWIFSRSYVEGVELFDFKYFQIPLNEAKKGSHDRWWFTDHQWIIFWQMLSIMEISREVFNLSWPVNN